MSEITCARCGKDGPQLTAPPLPDDLGRRLYDGACQRCWSDWLREQTAIINHYGLNVLDPKAKRFLTEQTEAFFFGAGPS